MPKTGSSRAESTPDSAPDEAPYTDSIPESQSKDDSDERCKLTIVRDIADDDTDFWERLDVILVPGLEEALVADLDHDKTIESILSRSCVRLIGAEPSLKCRILKFGYNANHFRQSADGEATEPFLAVCARQLWQQLREKRTKFEQAYSPICFLAHDIGGLIVKRALTRPPTDSWEDERMIHCDKALVFFGVPCQLDEPSNLFGELLTLVNKAGSPVEHARRIAQDLLKSIAMVNSSYDRCFTPMLQAVVNVVSSHEDVCLSVKIFPMASTNSLPVGLRFTSNKLVLQGHQDLVRFSIGDSISTLLLDIMKKTISYTSIASYRNAPEDMYSSAVPFSIGPPSSSNETLQQPEELSKWLKEDQPKFLVLRSSNEDIDQASAIASSVARGLQETQTPETAVLYFRCLEFDTRRSTLRPVIMTLLAQTVRQNRRFDKYNISGGSRVSGMGHLTDFELERLLQTTIQHLRTTIGSLYLIIDRLDSQNDALQAFIGRFWRHQLRFEGPLKVLVCGSAKLGAVETVTVHSGTSDEELLSQSTGVDVQLCSRILQTLSLQSGQEQFVTAFITALRQWKHDPRQQQFILQLVLRPSPTASVWERENKLHSLLQTPQQVLSLRLAQTPEIRRPWIRTLLAWLVYSFRPLTAAELSLAVSLPDASNSGDGQFMPHDIRSDIFENLGNVFEFRNGEMRWAYAPFRQWFLEGCGEDNLQWFNVQPFAHTLIAGACATYLSQHASCSSRDKRCSLELSVDDIRAKPAPHQLWDYVSDYWPQHFQLAAASDKGAVFVAKLIQSRDLCRSWWRRPVPAPLGWLRQQHPVSRAWLVLAAGLGLCGIITAVLQGRGHIVPNSRELAEGMVEAALHGQRGALQAIAAHHRPDDETILQLLENAAFSGDVEALIYAVEIATNERSQRQWPPLILYRLAQFGQHEAMQKAIELGADVEATLKNETATPLYIAAKYGQSSAAKCLTWHGAMVDKASKMKPSLPLEVACLSGDIDTVRALIQAEHKQMHGELGVFRSSSLPKALETAAKCGYAEAAEVLTSDIEEPATMRAAAERALVICAELKHNKIAEMLLSKDVLRCSDTKPLADALEKAVMAGNVSFCRTLVEYGVDVLEVCTKAKLIQSTARRGDVEMLEWLIGQGVNINGEEDGEVRATALHYAVSSRRLAATTLLLDNGAEVDHATGQGWTPLLVAAKNGDRELAKVLISHGADVEQTNKRGWAPLLMAFDQEPVVRLLLERGANVNATIEDDGASALYLAASNDCVDTMRTLIEWKAELEIVHESGHTPLTIAIIRDCTSAVRILLDAGANLHHKSSASNTVLHLAMIRALFSDEADIKSDDVILKDLLKLAPGLDDKNTDGNTPIHLIGSKTPVSWVRRLADRGANSNLGNGKRFTPLSYAVGSGNFEAVRFLLDRKVSVNLEGDTLSPLHFACSVPIKLDIVKALVGAEINVDNNNPVRGTALQFLLRHAVKENSAPENTAVAEYLINEAKVDLNVQGRENGSALNAACGWSTPEMVRLLLNRGASVHIKDEAGRSAGFYATFGGKETLELVLDADGAELTRKDGFQRTLLHFAAASGDPAELKHFLGLQHWDVNVRDVDGWTPLLWALRGWTRLEVPEPDLDKQKAVVQTLIDEGADVNAQGKGIDRCWTPLAVAHYHGRDPSIVELLQEGLLSDEEPCKIPAKAKPREDATCDCCSFQVVGFKYQCTTCTEYHLCYKCYRSRHLVHPFHEFEAVGPEFEGEEQAEQPGVDLISVFGSLPSSRRVSKAEDLAAAEAEAESEGYVTAHEA